MLLLLLMPSLCCCVATVDAVDAVAADTVVSGVAFAVNAVAPANNKNQHC